MFDHVKIGVSDYAACKEFFLKALAPLGVAVGAEGDPAYGVELCSHANASLCLFQTNEKPAHLHLAFVADSREQVDAFYAAALAAGGKDNGAPGLRPQYQGNYYAAFVIGPDGHNVEVVCHERASTMAEGHPPTRLASCSCGQLSALVVGDPVRVSICHCLACQRRTGSAFAQQARFLRENVTVTGTSTQYIRAGDEGSHATFHFCPQCSSIVYFEAEGLEAYRTIPVGVFADPDFPSPTVSMYEARKHAWVTVPVDAQHYD